VINYVVYGEYGTYNRRKEADLKTWVQTKRQSSSEESRNRMDVNCIDVPQDGD
jgi:hypothetical protein